LIGYSTGLRAITERGGGVCFLFWFFFLLKLYKNRDVCGKVVENSVEKLLRRNLESACIALGILFYALSQKP
ncbi:MAG: hypothetical protein AB1607_19005, partial [Chloroflexota bacterium]